MLNIRTIILSKINPSFSELKLIAQHRNINDYEKRYKEDLIKALRKPKLGIQKNKLKKKSKRFLQFKT